MTSIHPRPSPFSLISNNGGDLPKSWARIFVLVCWRWHRERAPRHRRPSPTDRPGHTRRRRWIRCVPGVHSAEPMASSRRFLPFRDFSRASRSISDLPTLTREIPILRRYPEGRRGAEGESDQTEGTGPKTAQCREKSRYRLPSVRSCLLARGRAERLQGNEH